MSMLVGLRSIGSAAKRCTARPSPAFMVAGALSGGTWARSEGASATVSARERSMKPALGDSVHSNHFMAKVVLAPAVARWLTATPTAQGEVAVEVDAATVRAALAQVFEKYPNL